MTLQLQQEHINYRRSFTYHDTLVNFGPKMANINWLLSIHSFQVFAFSSFTWKSLMKSQPNLLMFSSESDLKVHIQNLGFSAMKRGATKLQIFGGLTMTYKWACLRN